MSPLFNNGIKGRCITMDTKAISCGVVLCLYVLLCNVSTCESQAPVSVPIGQVLAHMQQMNDSEWLNLFAGKLTAYPLIFGSMKETVLTTLPLFQLDPSGLLGGYVVPWLFTHLPDVLKNEMFVEIAKLLVIELNQLDPNITQLPEEITQLNNPSLALDYINYKILGELDFVGMAVDLLRSRSIRDFFPYPYNTTDRQLNEQCYDDMMVFSDRLLAGDEWALDSEYNINTIEQSATNLPLSVATKKWS